VPGKRNENAGEVLHVLLGDPAHDAEVHEAEPAVGQHENVAGVGVGVEQPVLKDHLEKSAGACAGDVLPVMSHPLDPGEIVNAHALDLLEDQHALARKSGMDLGDDEDLAVPEIVAELNGVRGLDEKVEFFIDGAAELIHDARDVERLKLMDMDIDELGYAPEYADIPCNDVFDRGTLDLDHHLPAVEQYGAVDLGDGRGGHGRGVERGKEGVEGCAEVLFDDHFGLGKGERSDRIGQLGQFLGVFKRKEIGPACEDLAQLDERGAQLLEHEPEPLRRVQTVIERLLPAERDQAPSEGQHALKPGLLDKLPETVA